MHDVTRVHQPQADNARERRGDVAINDINLRCVQQPLIVGDGPLILRHLAALRGERLFGNRVLRHEDCVASQVHAGIGKQKRCPGSKLPGLCKTAAS